jgi:hypothetical protein
LPKPGWTLGRRFNLEPIPKGEEQPLNFFDRRRVLQRARVAFIVALGALPKNRAGRGKK